MGQFSLSSLQLLDSSQHETAGNHLIAHPSQDNLIGVSLDQPIDYLLTNVDVSRELANNGVVIITIIALTLFVREIRLLVVACKEQ